MLAIRLSSTVQGGLARLHQRLAHIGDGLFRCAAVPIGRQQRRRLAVVSAPCRYKSQVRFNLSDRLSRMRAVDYTPDDDNDADEEKLTQLDASEDNVDEGNNNGVKFNDEDYDSEDYDSEDDDSEDYDDEDDSEEVDDEEFNDDEEVGLVESGRSDKNRRSHRRRLIDGEDEWEAEEGGVFQFDREMRDAIASGVHAEQRTLTELLGQLRNPLLWYPFTRSIDRRVIMHVGPTNSGKTHTALQALVGSHSGIYCGPLRLLAHEIYDRLNQKHGVRCNLLTGQQKETVLGARHWSCTVELSPVDGESNGIFDVGIVDEFQLIGDPERGWAWTRAILGLPVRELHLCGSGAAVELVRRLCERAGDVVDVVNYERLGSLTVAKRPTRIADLRKGDAVIAFSRRDVHQLKFAIESTTEFRCSVVYGALPPATRVGQAELFNDPASNYDVLVATDAIGMGLNLHCRRVVFSTLSKFDGKEDRLLRPDEIKQIAGRAGRYQTLYPNGETSCFGAQELRYLTKALGQPWSKIEQACLKPRFEDFAAFHRIVQNEHGAGVPFSRSAQLLLRMIQTDKDFLLCTEDTFLQLMRLIEGLNFSLRDLYTFCLAPVNTRIDAVVAVFYEYAQAFCYHGRVPVLYTMPQNPTLEEVETLHSILDVYLWLCQHFPKTFTEQKAAESMSLTCASRLMDMLGQMTNRSKRTYLRERRRDNLSRDQLDTTVLTGLRNIHEQPNRRRRRSPSPSRCNDGKSHKKNKSKRR